MTTKARLTAQDRGFLATLGRAIFMNPFAAEREGLLAEIAPGHAGEAWRLDPGSYAFIASVDERLDRLDAKGWNTLARYAVEDRALVAPVFLYQVYHRHLGAIDALIAKQIATPGTSAPVPFAAKLMAELAARGFDESECERYLAVFYQLRRAFHFIVASLVGDSPSMRRLRHSLWNAVFTHEMHNYERFLWNRMEDFSTLLLGETGTGKGSAAAAVGRSAFIPYDRSSGRFAADFARTFVAINLSQYPESLIESELFGHRKGAFTGAIEEHAGVFERCSAWGALFLDEIGEVSVPVQVKLLEVLQDRRFMPLGGHERKRFAGRLIAATNRPLSELRTVGFRDDFFYRLSSDIIEMPTLRQRLDESPGELEQLVGLLVARTLGEPEPRLDATVLDALRRSVPKGYPWPGNVRELEQAVRRILLTGRYTVHERAASPATDDTFGAALRAGTLDARELLAGYCAQLHRQHRTYEEVARRTGLDRRTVRKYIAMAQ